MFTHAVLLRALARLHERQGGKNPNDIFPAETLGHQDLTRVETAIAAQVGSKRIATVDTGTLPRATRPLHFPGRPPRMHRGSAYAQGRVKSPMGMLPILATLSSDSNHKVAK